VPQMAGAERVVKALERRRATVYAGLILNEAGYDRLRNAGLAEAHVTLAASETLNLRNANRTIAESLTETERILRRARADGIRAVVTVAAAFGCPFEGKVFPSTVLEIAGRAVAAGCDELCLADTIGVGVPRRVRELVAGAAELGVPVGVHLHNT